MSRATDDSEDDEPRTAKKNPNPLLILGIVGGVLLLICGGGGVAGVLLLRNAGKSGVVQGETVQIETLTLRSEKEHRIGDLGITVLGCFEQYVDSTSQTGREMGSTRPYTVIRITLKNYNPNRNAKPTGQSEHATVTDDLGTKLGRIRPTDENGWECKPHGQIGDGNELVLRSDGPGQDCIIVERTVPGAKRVTVRLDASCYEGGSGWLLLDLPISRPSDPGFGLSKHMRADFDKLALGKRSVDVTRQFGTPNKVDKLDDGIVEYCYQWRVKNEPNVVAVLTFGTDGRVTAVRFK